MKTISAACHRVSFNVTLAHALLEFNLRARMRRRASAHFFVRQLPGFKSQLIEHRFILQYFNAKEWL
jgi:hypothetical protein